MSIMADTPNIIHAYVGTEIGLLKTVNVSKKIVANYGELSGVSRNKEICDMFSKSNDNVFIGLKNGVVQEINNGTSDQIRIQELFVFKENIPIRGICCLDDKLVVCAENGSVQIRCNNEEVSSGNVGSHISRMKQNRGNPNIVCTGGRENDLKIWNLENIEKPIFSAKNVRNDFLNLRVPVWITDAEFLQSESEHKIVVATGHHQLKLYDTKAQRRPVRIIEFSEHPVTALAISNDSSCAIAGNSAGYMGMVDLRVGKEFARFKGIAGSIRSIKSHSRQPYVVQCGIDRFLRVYDIKSKHLVSKIYLKTQLTSLSLTDNDICFDSQKEGDHAPGISESKRKLENSEPEEENDDVWNDMDVVKEQPKKKKHKSKKVTRET